MSPLSHQNRRENVAVLTAYYGVLIVFLLASFFPQYRVWGINWWAYYPAWVPFLLFAIGAVAPLLLRFVPERDTSEERRGRYFTIAAGLVLVYGLAFYFLRARMHFLGDGYTLLSQLASDKPLIKPRELGEALVHVWVKHLFGSQGETEALLTFQIISIAAGILFLTSVAVFARFLFERTRDRILFVLGLASSGYMLLFFGYVENYSLFVLAVTVYSLMGLLVARGKVARWIILPLLALAIFFHVLGLTLVPSSIYLLTANSRIGDWLSNLSRRTKLLMTLVSAVIAVSVFYYYYSTDYFFRFAFVPLFENRFTVEGHTLFSLKHIVDYLNLLILLLPGLPIVIAALFFLPLRQIFKQRRYRYLLILLASTLGAVFIFDPKLGMPRDWDLFSFAAIPLATFSYSLILDIRLKRPTLMMVGSLSVFLGLISIFPRAGSQMSQDISIAHFKNYLDLDKRKCRTARSILTNYYENIGSRDEAARLKREWRLHGKLFEDHTIDQATALINENKIWQSISLLTRVLDYNPSVSTAWTKLAQCHFMLGNYDSALSFLEISDGLNPYNSTTLHNMGLTCAKQGNLVEAKKYFLKAMKFDDDPLEPLIGLAYTYERLGSTQEYIDALLKIGPREEAPLDFIRRLGDYYLWHGKYELAAQNYQRALQKGLDSLYVKGLIEKYPQLKDLLN